MAADEAIYILDGVVSVEVDGTSTEIGVGSFAYVPAGSLCSWHARAGGAHVLVFHLPGGFDRALANGRGEDELVRAWDEARGTRYLRPQAFQTPAVPPAPDDKAVIV